jgi:hypothetical protein
MSLRIIILLIVLSHSLGVKAEVVHPAKQFEDKLSSCLPGGKKGDNCLVKTLIQFTKNEKLSTKLDGVIGSLFDQILAEDAVYAVHPVQSKKLGNFIVETNLMIEDDIGSYSLLTVCFLKTLGVWQVHNVNLTNVDESMDARLGIDL